MSGKPTDGVPPPKVSDQALAALREHFRSGREPVGQWNKGSLPVMPSVSMQLHSIALEVPPTGDSGKITRIATDGSAGDTGFAAASAVASTGQALVGWCESALPFNPSQYSELQGIRLALRLAGSLNGPVTVVCDSNEVVREVGRARRGDGLQLTVFNCDDPELFAEVAHLAAAIPDLTLAIQSHGSKSETAGNRRVAAGPLAIQAHNLAWAAQRMLGDGLDPAMHTGLLVRLAAGRTWRRGTLRQAYRAAQDGITPASVPIEQPDNGGA